MSNSITKLLRTKKTVFRVSDLAIFWKIKNSDTLKSKIYYLVNNKKLFRVHHGIFVFDEKEYDKMELAAKLKAPSYISLEAVLRNASFIFQHDTAYTSLSNGNKKYKVDGIEYNYRNIKDEVLFNNSGIVNKKNYSIATKERAFLDMIYLHKNYYFDNLDGLDWRKCELFLKIYNNKALEQRFEKYKKKYVR